MEEVVRKLAKSNKYQTLYNLSKEGSITIFNNRSNYTYYQSLFLAYLSFYNSIFTDLALDSVSPLVLENTIYEDAYMFYKSKLNINDLVKKKNNSLSNHDTHNDKRKSPIQKETIKTGSTSWVFKKPKK